MKKSDKPAKSAREKRSRILLIAAAAAAGLVLFIQGPTLLSALGGGGDDSASEETASAETTDTSQPAAAAADDGEEAPLPTELRDSDRPQQARSHELSTISTFAASGDPHDPLVVAADPTTDTGNGSGAAQESSTATSDPASDQPSGDSEGQSSSEGSSGDTSSEGVDSGTSSGSSGSSGSAPSTGASTTTPANVTYSAARLAVNDISQDVTTGGSFPTSNPVFTLSKITANSVSVGLVDGAFSTGTTSITIELGETRTLVSQPDGVRYTVRYDEPLNS